MTGANTIVRHLAQLRIYIERLRELQQHSQADMIHDWRIQSAVERNLQLAIEVVISVAEQLVSTLSLPLADTSRATIAALANAHIIAPTLAAELQSAVGFRNIIVHQYLQIDGAQVYTALEHGPAAFEAFLSEINTFLQQQP